MTNWLIVVLALINLGVFAWGLQREYQQREPHAENESGIPRLVLVQELPATQEEAAAKAAAAQAPEERGSTELPTSARSDMAPEAIANRGAEGSNGMSEGRDASETAGGLAGEPRGETVSPAPPASCYTLGPFPKRDDAEAVLEILRLSAAAADIRREVQQQEIGFWVLIPPMASESEAIAKVEELKAAGITDLWRFTRGSLANAISLGLFARQTMAQAHSEEVTRKGFVTEVRPRLAEKSTYWIDARFAEIPDTGSGVWARVRGDYPDVQSVTAQCEL